MDGQVLVPGVAPSPEAETAPSTALAPEGWACPHNRPSRTAVRLCEPQASWSSLLAVIKEQVQLTILQQSWCDNSLVACGIR